MDQELLVLSQVLMLHRILLLCRFLLVIIHLLAIHEVSERIFFRLVLMVVSGHESLLLHLLLCRLIKQRKEVV